MFQQDDGDPHVNRQVAARISALKSETEVLKFQRQFFEQALLKLRSAPGFAYQYAQQQQEEDGYLDDDRQDDNAECLSPAPLSPSKRHTSVSADSLVM